MKQSRHEKAIRTELEAVIKAQEALVDELSMKLHEEKALQERRDLLERLLEAGGKTENGGQS